jgi:hypothetical protein
LGERPNGSEDPNPQEETMISRKLIRRLQDRSRIVVRRLLREENNSAKLASVVGTTAEALRHRVGSAREHNAMERYYEREAEELESELYAAEDEKRRLIHENRELEKELQQAQDTCCLDGEPGHECLHGRLIR